MVKEKMEMVADIQDSEVTTSTQYVPMDMEDLDKYSTEIKELVTDIGKFDVECKIIKEKIKKLEVFLDDKIRDISNKKTHKEVPWFWRYNWNNNTKEKLAVLPTSELYVLSSGEITDNDRQLKLPLKTVEVK